MTPSRVLYITYDGVTDPLGRSQVLPYLIGLSRLGHRITLLSCEKPARFASDRARIQAICDEAGIDWRPQPYHKHPPVLSSAIDGWLLGRTGRRLHAELGFDIVHCRSYIPAAVGLMLKRRHGVRFLFDMRGFWPDEKVEGGSWPQTNTLFRAVYGYFKRLERRLLQGADHIISLTHAGERQLRTREAMQGRDTPITVIPCCVDFSHFPLIDPAARAGARAELGIAPGARVLAYLGSLGSWYMQDEMLDAFRVYRDRRPGARFLFVTPDRPKDIIAAAAARGIEAEALVIRAASREQVPVLMSAADDGLFFIRPVFSKTASSPTKMGEILALGLPLVTNGGVGDVAEIVADTGCGVAVERFDDATYDAAFQALETLATTPADRRERALPWFDVEIGIARYDAVYRSLVG